ncbi:hypothetical protein K438DRAFT_1990248 [Mycena galopus ATCC 62051]|nr:hypothetical protein K438DRAFT_1990248 [Mycena galopus ATCC 62051]
MANRSQEDRSLRDDDGGRMEQLVKEYEFVGDHQASTAEDVQMLGLKCTLEEADIVDRGANREPGSPRYGLEPKFLSHIARITAELQEFLFKASVLVPGRRRYFHVDPEQVLIPILEKSSDLPRILMAWEMLRKRIRLGHDFFLKYQKELRLPDSITDFSPASTTAKLQEEVKNLETADEKMRHVLAYYPHHYEGASTQRDERDRMRILRDDWLTIIQNLQGNESMDNFLRENSPAASRDREEAQNPVLENITELWEEETPPQEDLSFVSVPENGAKQGNAPEGVALSPGDGPQKTYYREERIHPPGREIAPQPLSHVTSKHTPPPLSDATTYSYPASMAAKTPYHSSKSFLKNWSDMSGIPIPIATPESARPNILLKLAAGPMGSVGDQYRKTFGKDEKEKGREQGSAPPLQPRPSNPFDVHSFAGYQPASSSTPPPKHLRRLEQPERLKRKDTENRILQPDGERDPLVNRLVEEGDHQYLLLPHRLSELEEQGATATTVAEATAKGNTLIIVSDPSDPVIKDRPDLLDRQGLREEAGAEAETEGEDLIRTGGCQDPKVLQALKDLQAIQGHQGRQEEEVTLQIPIARLLHMGR